MEEIDESTGETAPSATRTAATEVPIASKEAALWRLVKFDFAADMLGAEAAPATYGFLPALARRYLGRLMAESYCERVISYLGQVSKPQSSSADPVHTGNRVVVHMNKVHAVRRGAIIVK